MSEILDNLSRTCARGRGGILSIVFVPCNGITWNVNEGLATISTQTKVAKTVTLDINSGKFGSVSEGERDTFNLEYSETGEFTVKDDELLTGRVIASITGGLHTAIVRYANGKNKIFGKENGMFFNATEDSGTAGTDLNGYIVTGTAKSGNIPPHISNTDVDTIVAFTV